MSDYLLSTNLALRRVKAILTQAVQEHPLNVSQTELQEALGLLELEMREGGPEAAKKHNVLKCALCKHKGPFKDNDSRAPRRCGFDRYGFFDSDNNYCVTMQALSVALDSQFYAAAPGVFRAYLNAEWIFTVFLPDTLTKPIVTPEGMEVIPYALVVHQRVGSPTVTDVWVLVAGGHAPVPAPESMVAAYIAHTKRNKTYQWRELE